MQQQLGETIRKYRNKNGYTMNQLAHKLNISIGLLSNIETAKTDSFQLNLLNNIIKELDIPISELKLFSPSYSISALDIDCIKDAAKDSSKIYSSLKILIDAFIETSSTLCLNEDDTLLIVNMLVGELNVISKLIRKPKSK